MKSISHEYSAVLLLKVVLMMPHRVRAETLFVHKKLAVGYMRDLCDPVHFYTGERTDLILYNHALIHGDIANVGENFKGHTIGGDIIEVFRPGKEAPDFLQRARYELLPFLLDRKSVV